MGWILKRIIEGISEDARVSRAVISPRASFVASRRAGLAFRFEGAGCRRGDASSGCRDLKHLIGSSAKDLAEQALSKDLATASLGVAAINSLVEPSGGCIVARNGYDILLEWAGGGRVALVGHFKFVADLRARVEKLWVLELRPGQGDLPASEAHRVVPQADVVAITGTTFINHTLEGLLELAQGKKIMILGPSTIMSPILFKYGVGALCGSEVEDTERVLRELGAGQGFGHLGGLRRVALMP